MKGSILPRGEGRWLLKWDVERGADGKRRQRYKIVRGSKKDAARELRGVLVAMDQGRYVDPSKVSFGECLGRWLAWAGENASPKTLERYTDLANKHIRPRLGAGRAQLLSAAQLNDFYSTLRRDKKDGGAGLAPRTVKHIHRIVHGVLKRAVKERLITSNVSIDADPIKVPDAEIEILTATEIMALRDGLRGRALYMPASLALDTGLRRGELLALRWNDLDLDGGRLRVDESIEQTKALGLRPKPPKTRRGRRTITLPASTVAELRDYRRARLEERLALGLGKLPDDAFVFLGPDGGPRSPNALTREWVRAVEKLAPRKVDFHALRHTHASQLIAAGVDVVTVSSRLGHASPAITLRVYAHLFANTDERAAAAIDAARTPSPGTR